MLASAAAMSGHAQAAAAVNQYGSVKLQWNVAVQMTAVVHTNYTVAFAGGGGAPTIGASGTGSCGVTPGGQTDLTMQWGTIAAPVGATYQGCNYENALGVSVQTNDASGFAVYEYLDAALPAGTQICAYPNAGTTFPMVPAAAITTTQFGATIPGPYAAGACTAAAGVTPTVLGVGAGALTNAGAAPAQPNAAYTGEYVSAAAGADGFKMMGQASAAGAAVLDGEDLQMNISSAAPSTSVANNSYITLQFVAN